MQRPLSCLPLLVLAACQPQPAASVNDTTPQDRASPPAPDIITASPSFGCGNASNDVEKMICTDAELATLDRRLAERYDAALARAGANKNMLMSGERGWIKARNDCWKASGMRQCVLESYQTQQVDLQINHGDIRVPTLVKYICADHSKPLTAVFYNDLDPPAAVLTWGHDQTIVFPQRAASGARYGRAGVDFWEHQGEVKVDFHGHTFTCKTPG